MGNSLCILLVHWDDSTPLQYSCLENPMDRGAWKAAVHGVSEGRTRLSNFTFTFHFDALEKEMATHSSVLAWRIPGTGEPGGLPSMESHRVGHDWSDLPVARHSVRPSSFQALTCNNQPTCRMLVPSAECKLHGSSQVICFVHGPPSANSMGHL